MRGGGHCRRPAWVYSVFFFFFFVLLPYNEAKGDPLDNFNITRINFHFVNVFIYEK